jgi:hypothetical protein
MLAKSAYLRSTEPNLESGANIDCCKLYRDNKAVSVYYYYFDLMTRS